MDNGDPLFGKIRTEVPKQLNDKEFELAKTIVRSIFIGIKLITCPLSSIFSNT